MKYFALIAGISLGIGFAVFHACNRPQVVRSVSDLRVENNSTEKIHVSVEFGNSTQAFGVVSPGKSATVGFKHFEIGKPIVVHWDANDGVLNRSTTIDTNTLTSISDDRRLLVLAYSGNGEWAITGSAPMKRQEN